MTIQVTELAGSKSINKPPVGSRSAERTFIVYDDEGIIPTIDDMLLASGMPTINQAHPDSPSLFATGYTFSLNEERANTWQVTWSYTPFEVADTEEDEPEEAEFTGLDVSVSQVIIDIWKANPNKPANVDAPLNPAPLGSATAAQSDIGGDLVASMGYPISYALPIADITITQNLYTSNFNGYGFLSSVSKRNSAAWLGFPAGSVLFKGVDITKTSPNSYQLTYNLTWDMWYHLRQVPERDEDGNPKIDVTGFELYVFFRQPFPETTSFGFLPSV